MKQTFIQQVLNDQFVKRCIIYLLSFLLIGIIFSRLFTSMPDWIHLLESIVTKIP